MNDILLFIYNQLIRFVILCSFAAISNSNLLTLLQKIKILLATLRLSVKILKSNFTKIYQTTISS
ncbi:MAG: hypothetical protein KDD49_01135, partial [Bacteroidetes bacterium]|nr:hypothetical protein [Bacteroidota bacterium]